WWRRGFSRTCSNGAIAGASAPRAAGASSAAPAAARARSLLSRLPAQIPDFRKLFEAGRLIGGDGADVGARGAYHRTRRAQLPKGGRRGEGDRRPVAVTTVVAVHTKRFEQPGLSRAGRRHGRRGYGVVAVVVCEQTLCVGVRHSGGQRVP